MNQELSMPMFFRINFLAALLSASFTVHADWINLTGAETSPNIAEIYALDDHVKLVLEIYVGNLEAFDELIPDDWLKDPSIIRPPVEERLQNFANNKFQFITEIK